MVSPWQPNASDETVNGWHLTEITGNNPNTGPEYAALRSIAMAPKLVRLLGRLSDLSVNFASVLDHDPYESLIVLGGRPNVTDIPPDLRLAHILEQCGRTFRRFPITQPRSEWPKTFAYADSPTTGFWLPSPEKISELEEIGQDATPKADNENAALGVAAGFLIFAQIRFHPDSERKGPDHHLWFGYANLGTQRGRYAYLGLQPSGSKNEPFFQTFAGDGANMFQPGKAAADVRYTEHMEALGLTQNKEDHRR